MKVSIMQPNIFMWCGLLKSLIDSDLHIIRDDVKSTKNSRYNRNLIAGNGNACWMTIPFVGFKDSKLTGEQRLFTSEKSIDKLINLFCNRYRNYPFLNKAEILLQKTLSCPQEEASLCDVYINFLDGLRELGFPICKTVFASKICENNQSKKLYGVDKVNFLLNETNADTYFTSENTINYALPSEYNVKNVFVQKFVAIPYEQYDKKKESEKFIPNLSCLDIISCLPKDEILENLESSNQWQTL